MDELFQLKNILDEDGIFLSFSGPISQNLMVELGDILRKQMKIADADTTTILKVFSVLVEQSQNIIQHSAETFSNQPENGIQLITGTIAVGYKNSKYFVLAGNKIKKDQVTELKNRLDKIQKLGKEDLKELYRQTRKREKLSQHNNAGLGLIDLARKASEPIQYDFIPIDNLYTFFFLKTLI